MLTSLLLVLWIPPYIALASIDIDPEGTIDNISVVLLITMNIDIHRDVNINVVDLWVSIDVFPPLLGAAVLYTLSSIVHGSLDIDIDSAYFH
jgi:hypothetical protein